jgi:hypothetical protein
MSKILDLRRFLYKYESRDLFSSGTLNQPIIMSNMSDPTRRPLPLPLKYMNDTPEEYLERLMAFYKEYHWLIHVLAFNFVTLREWDNFPFEWREALMQRMEEAGDDWAKEILDLTSETSDYVRTALG